jgi:hypothetical protein
MSKCTKCFRWPLVVLGGVMGLLALALIVVCISLLSIGGFWLEFLTGQTLHVAAVQLIKAGRSGGLSGIELVEPCNVIQPLCAAPGCTVRRGRIETAMTTRPSCIWPPACNGPLAKPCSAGASSTTPPGDMLSPTRWSWSAGQDLSNYLSFSPRSGRYLRRPTMTEATHLCSA